LPCDRIARVVAMESASLSMVTMSSTVGNEVKSSGFCIHSATIRISTETAIDSASPKSIRKAGIGRNWIDRMRMTPKASATSRP
jgi:hypothetical protein